MPDGKVRLGQKRAGVDKAVLFLPGKKVTAAAICGGVTFFAKNGLPNNFEHTGNSLENLLKTAGKYAGKKKYVKPPAVSDGNFIKATGTSALEFAVDILLNLKITEEEKADVRYSFFKKVTIKDKIHQPAENNISSKKPPEPLSLGNLTFRIFKNNIFGSAEIAKCAAESCI